MKKVNLSRNVVVVVVVVVVVAEAVTMVIDKN